MKVLQVNATYGLGSTGTILSDVLEFCEANGIECHVVDALVDSGYMVGMENRCS